MRGYFYCVLTSAFCGVFELLRSLFILLWLTAVCHPAKLILIARRFSALMKKRHADFLGFGCGVIQHATPIRPEENETPSSVGKEIEPFIHVVQF